MLAVVVILYTVVPSRAHASPAVSRAAVPDASLLERAIPVLSFQCPAYSFPSSLSSTQKTSRSEIYTASTSPMFDAGFLGRSRLFNGTGHEVQRVIQRAMDGKGDGEPFRILILGGSSTSRHT